MPMIHGRGGDGSPVPIQIAANGAVTMFSAGLESTANTTTTALGSGATYTGTFEQNNFSDVMVSCQTDNGGTLYFDFSVDGTNVSTFPVGGFDVASGIHEFHTEVKGPRYFRVRLVNDTGAQSYLRLYTYYGAFRQGNAPLNQNLAQDSDAILTRGVDSFLDIALDRFTGFKALNKFGRAPDGVQTTATDIWDRADATPTQQIWLAPTAARIHSIVSTSTDDDGSPVGVGARTVRVWGLTSWSTAETSEDIVMNGQTPVNTVNSYVIIHRMRVLTSGGTSRNVGTITATAATDGTITAVIRPGIGSTEMAIYGIPSTQTLVLTQLSASIQKSSGAASHALVRLFTNPEPDVQTTQFTEVDLRALQSTGTSSMAWA